MGAVASEVLAGVLAEVTARVIGVASFTSAVVGVGGGGGPALVEDSLPGALDGKAGKAPSSLTAEIEVGRTVPRPCFLHTAAGAEGVLGSKGAEDAFNVDFFGATLLLWLRSGTSPAST